MAMMMSQELEPETSPESEALEIEVLPEDEPIIDVE